ncbi:HD domain-containing protein [bacterium]|nr:HD domain-containing protein [bacterium]MBU1754503.1 HD domain-containing protein [bacterium]
MHKPQNTIEDIKKHPLTNAYIKGADENLDVLGYTEHGIRHATIVSQNASKIMTKLWHEPRVVELTEIAGYLHDIGNVVNRKGHSVSGALLAVEILKSLGFIEDEITAIIRAIGNHDEEEGGGPVSNIAAAVILADKADIHRSRVRNPNMITFDIHDRVNYAATYSSVEIDADSRIISLNLTIDTHVSQIMEYFEIFLSRMMICRKAAVSLNCKFEIVVNDIKLL